MGGHVGRLHLLRRRRTRQSRKHMPYHRHAAAGRAFILPVIVLFFHLPEPDASAAVIGGFALPLILGISFICVATHLPSHTDASAKPPVLYEQIVGTWNLDDLSDCRNTDGGDWLHGDALPESELRDGDWNCTVYKGGRRTTATVHIHGDRVGLYDSKGKAWK